MFIVIQFASHFHFFVKNSKIKKLQNWPKLKDKAKIYNHIIYEGPSNVQTEQGESNDRIKPKPEVRTSQTNKQRQGSEMSHRLHKECLNSVLYRNDMRDRCAWPPVLFGSYKQAEMLMWQ